MFVQLYDTTLRDGSQGEGVNFSLQDKLTIARRLDELGVDYIEGGYPLSNPKDVEFFQEVKKLPLKNAKICAFGMTRRKNCDPKDDVCLKALLDAQTPVVTVQARTPTFLPSRSLGLLTALELICTAPLWNARTRNTGIAVNGAEAYELAAQWQPELALLDIGMPVMDGYEAVKRMREQPWGKQLLIVALSGWGQTADVQRSRDAGFDSHLVKPASFESLAEVLGRVAAASVRTAL